MYFGPYNRDTIQTFYTVRIINLLVTLAFCPLAWAQHPSAIKNGKFFSIDSIQYLYGGENKDQHFVINNLELHPDQFHYGLGREAFPALISPKFESLADANKHWKNTDRFLVVYVGNETKAYAIKDLIRHEVVNDVISGKPIFAAYCILADLGAIYTRTYGDKTLTFAVSGYTYYDQKIWNGLDAFVLWDRETESLWWPLLEKAVSGKLKSVPLCVLEKTQWEEITWEDLKKRFSSAQILISNQSFNPPKKWEKYEDVESFFDY